MAKIPQPKYACYILSDGRIAVGTKANFRDNSYLKMKDGRSVRVKDYHISLDNCAIIPVAKLPVSVYPNFEGVRGKRIIEEPVLRAYLAAEKHPGRLELHNIVKPFTISESPLVKEVERKMASVKTRLENLRKKKEAAEAARDRERRAMRYETDTWKKIIRNLKEL